VAVRGTARVPGDKSISHRALLFAALADGDTRIHGLNAGDDVARTRAAIEAFGAPTADHVEGVRVLDVHGTAGRLREPSDILDVGNSGTSLRLLAGLAATIDGLTVFTGDASLRRRPVHRVAEPLAFMGATCDARADGRWPPLVVRGPRGGRLRAIAYDLPVASAQVKSALLLAGLNADGRTSLREPFPSRDHTERMLRAGGVEVAVRDGRLELDGPQTLRPPRGGIVHIPGDPSAAAFLLVAALLCPESDVSVNDVCVNPTRAGWVDVLRAMGARIDVRDERVMPSSAGEPVGTLHARTSELAGVEIAPDLVPRLIDEMPILCIAAACAKGVTVLSGAADLRAKESDRITAMARGLSAMGVAVEERADGLVIHGRGGAPLCGAEITSEGDHRVAMSFAVAGLVAEGETVIDDATSIATSFPQFEQALTRLAT
jgi:3-phosphoshikimate 1-carboxyvinyltransferase